MWGMARLLVFWTRAAHLSVEEADSWARAEASRLLDLEAVVRAELTRLHAPSAHHPRAWDWLLEVHLATGADEEACVESTPCVEWLADLRLLGMRPLVLFAPAGVELSPRRR
jgi:hypothetical protein